MTLTEVFASTAEAIRKKTGKNDKIKPINFASEIETITGGGGTDTSDATASASDILSGKTAYTKNGLTTGAMPNNGLMNKTFDGISKKSVSIPAGYTYGGVVGLDDTIDNTANEQTDLIAQIMAKVNSLPNTSGGGGGEVLLQEKTITENGIYIPDEGFDGFSQVSVNVVGGGEQPTLFAPSIQLNSVLGTLTITDNKNGAFEVLYDLYADDNKLATLSSKTATLTDYMEHTETVEVKVQAIGTNFNSSEFSVVEWTYFSAGGTVGLAYTLSSDGAYATCTSIGEAIDTDIEILALYEGVPVTEIGSKAFYSKQKITSVVIPDSVLSIGSEAFADCRGITSIVIGSSVTSIGYSAFNCCNHLPSMVIPASVRSIGGDWIRYCWALKRVDFSTHTVIPSLTNTWYHDTHADLQIKVPEVLYEEWKSATNWSYYANKIVTEFTNEV